MPFRNNSWSLQPWKTIIKGSLVLIFTGLSLLILERPLGKKIYLGKDNDIENSNNNWRNNIYSVYKDINGEKCHGERSYSDKKILEIFENCTIANPDNKNKRTVAFVGDSHNLTLMKAQKLIYEEVTI